MQFKTTAGLFESFGDPMYTTLMDERSDLQRQLQAAERTPAEKYRRKAELAEQLADREAQVVMSQAKGFKGLGANDTERKYALTALLQADAEYQRTRQALMLAEQEYKDAQLHVDNLRSALSANGNAMRLHSALVLAQSAVTVHLPTGNGNGAPVLVADDLEL